MKKIQILTLLVLFVFVSTNLQAQLSWSPEKITAGEKVTLTYDSKDTPLADKDAIVINLYQVDIDEYSVKELPVQVENGKFTSSFTADSNTKALFFGVHGVDMKTFDNNKKGYKTVIYQSDRKTAVEKGYASKAMIVSQFITDAEGNKDSKKALKLMNKEFATYPSSSKDIELQDMHLGIAAAAKDEAAMESHSKMAAKIMKSKKPSEMELAYAYKYAKRVTKDEEVQATLKEQMMATYPKSDLAARAITDKIRGTKEVAERIEILKMWDKDFANDESKKGARNYIVGSIASKYAKAKDWDNYQKYLDMIDDAGRKSSALNGVAWGMSGESLEAAAPEAKIGQKLAKQSLEILDAEMKALKFKPDYYTMRQYKTSLKFSKAMNADTYALLAYKNGDVKDALVHQQMSCDANEFRDAEMNERYCVYFEEVNGEAATEELIGGLMAKSKASKAMKERHKELFMANNSLEAAYGKYVSQLEERAKSSILSQLQNKMIDEPSPKFELVNLKGDKVSSDDLIGKVVVVDFWATWCGPCKASFPAMQEAVNKFEKSEDVEFVFIDTWESGKNVEKKVGDFIDKHNYTFNVLMDGDAATTTAYGVKGIPAKFVIGKDGNIKFESSGFNGSNDELVQELTMMIELAGGTVPAAAITP